jgi:predicted PolB exonuclease-like 3'-5' exonuclease
MREKPEHDLAIVIDIETVAIDDAGDYIEAVNAPSNYRDATKIEDYVRMRLAEKVATAALDPNLNKVVALGWMVEARDIEPRIFIARDVYEEKYLLQQFWLEIACAAGRTRRTISFNGLMFDLPTLRMRSLYLDVPASRTLVLDRYRTPHIDLCAYLSFNRTIPAHSLTFFAKRFGLPVSEAELERSGADIAGYVQAGDWDSVRAHCASDVKLTYALAQRLHVVDADEEEDDSECSDDVVGW